MTLNTMPSTGQLAGRRILVTGAARGLGFAFAQTLCQQGARLVMADLRAELLNEAVARLRAMGFEAPAHPRFAKSAINPGTVSGGVAMTARSGSSGNAATDG